MLLDWTSKSIEDNSGVFDNEKAESLSVSFISLNPRMLIIGMVEQSDELDLISKCA